MQDAKNDAMSVSKFIFIQVSAVNFQMLMNCLQKWQTVQLHKYKKTDSKFIFNNSTNLQNSNELIRILIRLRIFQNHKKSDWFCILLQIVIDELNIAEFFTQNIISWVSYVSLNTTCIRARNKFRLHLW